MKEIKEIEMNIEEIVCIQKFGFQTVYYKEENIKHKRKKIDGFNYNTKKSKLVFYKNEYTHENNFNICFLYEAENGNYFRRSFTSMSEEFVLINKSTVVNYLNINKTLF